MIEVNMKELAKYLCDKYYFLIGGVITIKNFEQFTQDIENWIYKHIPEKHIIEESELNQVLEDIDFYIRAELIQRLMLTFKDYQIKKEE